VPDKRCEAVPGAAPGERPRSIARSGNNRSAGEVVRWRRIVRTRGRDSTAGSRRRGSVSGEDLVRLVVSLVAALTVVAGAAPAAERATATFAGGCFWCMERPFEDLPGVLSVTSGFTGGHAKDPTYDQVSAGKTGHAEAVQIVFDPAKITYEELLDVFWHNVDPLTPNAQFCDRGSQYRSAIFYEGEAQQKAALASKKKIEDSKRFDKPVATEIVAASTFYPAEEYHQDFYKKNPVRYLSYRTGCGRDRRLHELWGDAAGAHR
jgi:peptide-methionine (S)-S-oxide reductase